MDQFPNNRPSRAQIRRTRRLLLAALVLAWATQLLVSQWTRGASADEQSDCDPATCRLPSVTVSLRPTATAVGSLKLGDVCDLIWSSTAPATADGGRIDQIILAHKLSPASPVVVRLEEVLAALTSAGVHEHSILVEGPIRCDVTVSAEALGSAAQDAVVMAWAGADEEARVQTLSDPRADSPSQTQPEAPQHGTPQRRADAELNSSNIPEFVGVHGSLGEMLRRDLARQLRLPLESLNIHFAAESAGLAERMDIPAERIELISRPDLGDVTWLLKLSSREIHVKAHVSASVTRTVTVRRIPAGHVIRDSDITAQQARITRLAERGLARTEALGKQSARDIAAGEVLGAGDLAQRLLARRGEYVSVQVSRNGIEIRALARALEDGVLGQVIKARSETTGEILEVTLTAPQAGKAVSLEASASATGQALPQR